MSFSESDIDSDSIVKLEPVLRTGNVAPSSAITSVYTIHQTPSAVSNHAPVAQSQTVMPPLSGCSSADSVRYLTTSANHSSIAVGSTPSQTTYQNKTIVVMPAGLKTSSNAAQPLVKHIKINWRWSFDRTPSLSILFSAIQSRISVRICSPSRIFFPTSSDRKEQINWIDIFKFHKDISKRFLNSKCSRRWCLFMNLYRSDVTR